MSTEKQEQALPSGLVAIKRIANPTKQVIYVNNAFVFANQWDIQMTFATVREVSPGEFGSVDEATIIMTPEHALAFAKALENTLHSYSQSQGTIREIKAVELSSTSEKS